jgi:hypothetical protein
VFETVPGASFFVIEVQASVFNVVYVTASLAWKADESNSLNLVKRILPRFGSATVSAAPSSTRQEMPGSSLPSRKTPARSLANSVALLLRCFQKALR